MSFRRASFSAIGRGLSDEATLPLEDFFGIDSQFELDREKHVMSIICRNRVFTLAFHNQAMLDNWKAFISLHLGKEKCYHVTLVKAPPSLRCRVTEVNLFVRGRALCIATCSDSATPPMYLASWSISGLRRFGTINGRFCFEAGESTECPGVVAVASEHAAEIESLLKDADTFASDRLADLSIADNSVFGSHPSLLADDAHELASRLPTTDAVYHNVPRPYSVDATSDSLILGSTVPADATKYYYNVPQFFPRTIQSHLTTVGHDPLSPIVLSSPPLPKRHRTSAGHRPYANCPTSNSAQPAVNNTPAPEIPAQSNRCSNMSNSVKRSDSVQHISPDRSASRPPIQRCESLGSVGLNGHTTSKPATTSRSNDPLRRRYSLGDIYRKLQAVVVDGFSFRRNLQRSASKASMNQTANLSTKVPTKVVADHTLSQQGFREPGLKHRSASEILHHSESTEKSSALNRSKSPEKQVPPPPPPRLHVRTNHKSSSADDGYIDTRQIVLPKQRQTRNQDLVSCQPHEAAPLLTKRNTTAVSGTSVGHVHDDVVNVATDAVELGLHRCLSRCCSVGSQLSAIAASTVYEESFSDLTLDKDNSCGEYMPMSRVSSEYANDSMDKTRIAASSSAATASTDHSVGKTTSFSALRTVVVPSTSARPRSAVTSTSQNPRLLSELTLSTVVPLPVSYRSPRDDQGYLIYQPSTATPRDAVDSSLERLGPAPGVPSSQLNTPPLPPKQSAVAAPIVPPRDAVSLRPPEIQRRASRKPNLTVSATACSNHLYTGSSSLAGVCRLSDFAVVRRLDDARNSPDSVVTSSRTSSQEITTRRPRYGAEYQRINRRRLGSASGSDTSPLPLSAVLRGSPASAKTQSVFTFDNIQRSQVVATSGGVDSPLSRTHSARGYSQSGFSCQEPSAGNSTPQVIQLDEVIAPTTQPAAAAAAAAPSPKIQYIDLMQPVGNSSPVTGRQSRPTESATNYAVIDFEATSAAALAGREHVRRRQEDLDRHDTGRTAASRLVPAAEFSTLP